MLQRVLTDFVKHWDRGTRQDYVAGILTDILLANMHAMFIMAGRKAKEYEELLADISIESESGMTHVLKHVQMTCPLCGSKVSGVMALEN